MSGSASLARRLRRARKAVAYVVNLPIYWLTRVTPRKADRWVFGAWLGTRYADNPRHLLEYVEQHLPWIECVWVATSDTALAQARAAGVRAVRAYGPTGYWLTATAGLALVSGGRADVNRYVCPDVVYNLWHGINVKRVEYDSPVVAARLERSRRLSRWFPFHASGPFAAVNASSRLDAERMSSAFRVPPARVPITGQPRNDGLAAGARAPADRWEVLYAPTFRDTDPLRVVSWLEGESEVLVAALTDLGVRLHVRLHPSLAAPRSMTPGDVLVWDSPLASADDLTEHLGQADALVTDYSTVYVDYLLTDRPILFLSPDREEYERDERGLYDSPADPTVAPGPLCSTWAEVVMHLGRLRRGEDPHRESRDRARRRYHDHVDGGASARSAEVALRLAGLGTEEP